MTVVSATSITATTPAHAAAAVNVVVTTPAGTGTGTNLFTYTAPVSVLPTVTAVSPKTGPPSGGSSVTITGTNFTNATTVMFGACRCAILQRRQRHLDQRALAGRQRHGARDGDNGDRHQRHRGR